MKDKGMKFVLSLAALAALLSGVANAQSCSTWASNVVTYEAQQAPQWWGARLTTNQSDGQLVSYSATGGASNVGWPLTYVAGHRSGSVYFPPSLQTTAQWRAQDQLFSDRIYSDPVGQWAPFNPLAPDSLGITIWLGTGGIYRIGSGYSIQPGEVTFTLYSWGGEAVTFVPERCDAVGAPPSGLIYGLYGNSGLLLSLFTGGQSPP